MQPETYQARMCMQQKLPALITIRYLCRSLISTTEDNTEYSKYYITAMIN